MRRHNTNLFIFITVLLIFFTICCDEAVAEIKSGGVLDSVLKKYGESALQWAESIQNAATRLFWVLTTISMVWTFAQLMFHRSSFAELFGELIRFIMFTGFYLWLLRNGPQMANDIIISMGELAKQASGQNVVTPSSIVDIGFKLFDTACQNLTIWSPIVSAGCFLITSLILIVLALVGINMLLQFCSAWVLAYAGIFFLGFGGSRWTSDMAINYFKTVLGVGTSLMTMALLVGIGTGIINEYHQQMTAGMELQELGILLVVSITLLLLVDKLPAMVSGIITGASIGSNGGGSFGAGAAVGAAMTAGGMAMGAASAGGRAVLAGAANIAGATSAFNAARQAASPSEKRDALGMTTSMGNKSSIAAELGKGVMNMGKQATSNAAQGFAERAQSTMGGKLADTIKNAGKQGGSNES